MDWKVFFMTFGAIFLAEVADKTQLVGIGMASESKKPLSVWMGSVFAYMVITLVSVLIGASLGKYIKPEFIRFAGASLFFIIAIPIFLDFLVSSFWRIYCHTHTKPKGGSKALTRYTKICFALPLPFDRFITLFIQAE